MWFPVDPVPIESTLRVRRRARTAGRGTCRGRSSTARPSGSPTARSRSCRRSTTTPSASACSSWALEPGDAVFFHMLTLHAAGGVGRPAPAGAVGAVPRRRHGARARGAWTTSPPFPGLADELPAGAPMDHPLFPVLLDAHRDDRGRHARCGVGRPGRRPSCWTTHLDPHAGDHAAGVRVRVRRRRARRAARVVLHGPGSATSLVGCGAARPARRGAGRDQVDARSRGGPRAWDRRRLARPGSRPTPRSLGLRSLWLETGVTDHFAAAEALYRAHGYERVWSVRFATPTTGTARSSRNASTGSCCDRSRDRHGRAPGAARASAGDRSGRPSGPTRSRR